MLLLTFSPFWLHTPLLLHVRREFHLALAHTVSALNRLHVLIHKTLASALTGLIKSRPLVTEAVPVVVFRVITLARAVNAFSQLAK